MEFCAAEGWPTTNSYRGREHYADWFAESFTGYRDVPESQVVCIDRDLRVTQHEL